MASWGEGGLALPNKIFLKQRFDQWPDNAIFRFAFIFCSWARHGNIDMFHINPTQRSCGLIISEWSGYGRPSCPKMFFSAFVKLEIYGLHINHNWRKGSHFFDFLWKYLIWIFLIIVVKTASWEWAQGGPLLCWYQFFLNWNGVILISCSFGCLDAQKNEKKTQGFEAFLVWRRLQLFVGKVLWNYREDFKETKTNCVSVFFSFQFW